MGVTYKENVMSNSKLEGLLQSMRQGTIGLNKDKSLFSSPQSGRLSEVDDTHALKAPVMSGKTGYIHRLMALVENRFGIHPSSQVERKLERIFDKLPEDALREWLDKLVVAPSSDGEWLSLVESLTVHETYFCRDKPMMSMLSGDVLPQLIEQKRSLYDYTIKVWSAGCSTGEETYNIAMLVLQALIAKGEAEQQADGVVKVSPRWRLVIIGTDVSRQVVRTASDAVYADFGMGSFRDMTEAHWKFFEPAEEVIGSLPGVGYFRVKPCLRRHVFFRQHNLLSNQPPETGCDLVVCRNVMIYFQVEAKRQVQELFHRALAPRGALLLGGTDVQYWPERYERQYGGGGTWYVRK